MSSISNYSIDNHGQKKNEKGRLFYHFIALLIVIIWGTTLVNTKILLQYGMREDEIFFARMIIAYLSILFISPRKLWADNWRDELWMMLLGITGGSLYFISENYALQYTMANNVSFIISASPLFTALITLTFTKGMKLEKTLLIGTLLAIVGVGIVIFGGQVGGLKVNPIGDFLAIVSSFCFGLYCFLLMKCGNKYSPVFITRKVFAYGMLTTVPLFIFMPWQFDLSRIFEPGVLFNLLFLGLIASFACFALWSVVTKKLGAVVAANYNYISPIATILTSWLFLNERMTILSWIGCALILLGVIIANKNNA
ncbi:MAG: DMT family transporter [Prevotella sp.]|nr:DMT family transporter [Prevotella sp.]